MTHTQSEAYSSCFSLIVIVLSHLTLCHTQDPHRLTGWRADRTRLGLGRELVNWHRGFLTCTSIFSWINVSVILYSKINCICSKLIQLTTFRIRFCSKTTIYAARSNLLLHYASSELLCTHQTIIYISCQRGHPLARIMSFKMKIS